MKISIIGSRTIKLKNLEKYLPEGIDTIISGGAVGVDTSAREYARKKGLKMVEYFPDYERYGRKAPLVRNIDIINEGDYIYAFWDGKSRGTGYSIDKAREMGKVIRVIKFDLDV